MRDTATAILDVTQHLIQTRGFSATSLQEIAAAVGIRKPTIVHHFSSKAVLGEAVVQRYRCVFEEQLETIVADAAASAWDALDFYVAPFREVSNASDKVCLCGALAGELMALDPAMQREIRLFFEDHERWLEGILRSGADAGVFTLVDQPQRLARFYFSALQGALLVSRASQDAAHLNDVVDAMRATLKGTDAG